MMKQMPQYRYNRRIEAMINISLVLVVLLFIMLTSVLVLRGMR